MDEEDFSIIIFGCLIVIYEQHNLSVGNQRFLYPQYQSSPAPGPSAASAAVEEDDGLGPLPAGWERRVQPEGRVYFVNHKVSAWQLVDVPYLKYG